LLVVSNVKTLFPPEHADFAEKIFDKVLSELCDLCD
jgi:hypothetical protein